MLDAGHHLVLNQHRKPAAISQNRTPELCDAACNVRAEKLNLKELFMGKFFSRRLGYAVGLAVLLTVSRTQALVITPTFTTAFNANFGANAAAAQAAWISAANVFTANFTDNIHVNITVDAVTGTSVFGQSSTFLYSVPYSSLITLMNNDKTTANDNTAVLGSLSVPDPTSGAGTWWISTAQAKAIGYVADNLSADGTTKFGTGNPFTFAGPIAPGTFDFQGVAAHEISEVLGRLGISGGTIGATANSYSLIDLFSYKGPGVAGIGKDGGNFFSIDAGTTLIKGYNNGLANGLDSRDWVPGSNDSFNQFSNSGVVNPVSGIDLQVMDVLGYDLAPVPEPAVGSIALAGAAAFLARKRLLRRGS